MELLPVLFSLGAEPLGQLVAPPTTPRAPLLLLPLLVLLVCLILWLLVWLILWLLVWLILWLWRERDREIVNSEDNVWKKIEITILIKTERSTTIKLHHKNYVGGLILSIYRVFDSLGVERVNIEKEWRDIIGDAKRFCINNLCCM